MQHLFKGDVARLVLFSLGVMSLLFLSGCATRSTTVMGDDSYDGVSHEFDTENLAINAAIELLHRYPPGHTTLALARVPGAFGEKFEACLRDNGFAVAASNGSGIRVGYILDMIVDENTPTGYLQINISDGERFSIVRKLSNIVSVEDTTPSQLVPVKLLEKPVETELQQLDRMIVEVPIKPWPQQPKEVKRQSQNAYTKTGKTWPVHTEASAANVAKRNDVSVQNFCDWNDIEPSEILHVGTPVYLWQPKLTLTHVFLPESKPEALQASSTQVSSPVNILTSKTLSEQVIPQKKKTENSISESTLPPISEPLKNWSLRKGGLQDQLGVWAERADYQLVWNAEHDYYMEIEATFKGSFLTAMQKLVSGLNAKGNPLRAKLYESNKVLEIFEE